ncbi:MAG: FecR domain-containing protein [Desulfobaccales bacterium]
MRKFSFFCVVFVILALQLGPLTDAQADVVGRLTQVEGRVDLLKGGQLPATPVKTNDTVQPGDVLRTKSLSKAQITFIDNSTMTLAPESRVAIEAYTADQNKRNAVIELFKGIAFMVVNKVYQSAEPDFVVKTQTAIMGIRGTEFGVRLQPNSSDILNFKGRLQVGNVYPEVGQLDQRALKVAYSFGNTGGGHWIFLDAMQGTSVGRGLPPTLPWTISDEDKRHFFNQMGTGLNICRRNPENGEEETGGGPPSESITGCAPTTGLTGSDITTKQDLLSAGYYEPWFTPPYTPPRDPQFTGTEPPSNPGNGPTPPPPCDHKPPHHDHNCDRDDHHDKDKCDKDRHDKCDFHFDRDFFCRRDRDNCFDKDFCKTKDRDDRFDCDRDSYSRKDHDGKFDFDFAKNCYKPKDRDDRFDKDFCKTNDRDDRFDCDRDSYSRKGHDGKFDFDFAKNCYKPKDRDDRFDKDFCKPKDRDDRFDKDFCKTNDRDDRFDRDRDSYSRKDHDGKFDFDFAKNCYKPKDRDDRFDKDFCKTNDRDDRFDKDFCKTNDRDDRFDRDRDSYSRKGHDGKFDFDFAKNCYKPKDRDDRFDKDFCKAKDRDDRFDKDFCKTNDRDDRFDRDRDSYSRKGHDGKFDFNFAKNFCKPKGHDGPNVTNFIQHTAITNPRLLLSEHCPGDGPGKILGHPGGPPTGINNAVFNPKDKCAPKGNIHPGGPINASFQGGPQGNNHQGPAPGPCGPKNGGGGV